MEHVAEGQGFEHASEGGHREAPAAATADGQQLRRPRSRGTDSRQGRATAGKGGRHRGAGMHARARKRAQRRAGVQGSAQVTVRRGRTQASENSGHDNGSTKEEERMGRGLT